MDFMFEWQEQCSVYYMDVLNVVDKIYTATINFVRRFNSEKSCLQIKSKHLQ